MILTNEWLASKQITLEFQINIKGLIKHIGVNQAGMGILELVFPFKNLVSMHELLFGTSELRSPASKQS